MQWCGPDAEFAEWGMDDVPVLKQNLFLCNLDESRPTQWYDLQQIFLREHPRKEGEGMTLESVVTRMGIPMERPFHDALSDTLYTADVCRKLDLRAGLAATPPRKNPCGRASAPPPAITGTSGCSAAMWSSLPGAATQRSSLPAARCAAGICSRTISG